MDFTSDPTMNWCCLTNIFNNHTQNECTLLQQFGIISIRVYVCVSKIAAELAVFASLCVFVFHLRLISLVIILR